MFLSYSALYFLTTVMKAVCCKLVDIPNDNDLLSGDHLKRMIDILVQIMFAFGFKFVFTNSKEWSSFLGLSTMNCMLTIFVNGSFQSHQYGKHGLNRMRETVNNLLCKCGISKQLEMTDFD